jgi:hypothetical protein
MYPGSHIYPAAPAFRFGSRRETPLRAVACGMDIRHIFFMAVSV